MGLFNIFRKGKEEKEEVKDSDLTISSRDCVEELIHESKNEVKSNKLMINNGVDSYALFLSIEQNLFYDVFLAGEYWESEKQQDNYDFEDITKEISLQFPDFMNNKFSQLCDAFLKLREKDTIDHIGTVTDNIQTAMFVNDYENIIPGLSLYNNFVEILVKLPDEIALKLIVLPQRKKIVKFDTIVLEEFIKPYQDKIRSGSLIASENKK